MQQRRTDIRLMRFHNPQAKTCCLLDEKSQNCTWLGGYVLLCLYICFFFQAIANTLTCVLVSECECERYAYLPCLCVCVLMHYNKCKYNKKHSTKWLYGCRKKHRHSQREELTCEVAMVWTRWLETQFRWGYRTIV